MPVNIYRCKIGNGTRIGPFVEIQAGAVVGDGTVISSHSFICGGARIGSGVFIGHHVTTCNDRWPVANAALWECDPPTIEDNANVGSGAVILPGVIIGEGATVGAGAIVTKDVAPHTTVKGVY